MFYIEKYICGELVKTLGPFKDFQDAEDELEYLNEETFLFTKYNIVYDPTTSPRIL